MSNPELVVATDPDPALDRRARSRQRRRDRVYEAAVELIVANGFDNTTMDEIAERADVARATVFNHFQRKAAFLDEWGARRRQRALRAVYSYHLEDHSVREILEACMVELARVSTESRVETVALMAAAVHSTNVLGRPALAVEFANFLERAQAEDQLSQQTDPQLGGLLLATGYFAVLTAWIEEEPAPFDLRTQLLGMLNVVLDGIQPSATSPPAVRKPPRTRKQPR
jgi:AcrR family transcriptional regulator